MKQKEPTVALALDGPPLAVAGEMDGLPLEGSIERKGMVGYGKFRIRSATPQSFFSCESDIDTPPTDKGRVRGALQCNNKQIFIFTLRNLGPDQGVGVARTPEGDKTMIFFYHASKEEAKRRLPQVLEDIREAQTASAQ